MNSEQLQAEGWKTIVTAGFGAISGPYWVQGEIGQRRVGLLVEPKHGNHIERAHGGALMPFADVALGMAVADRLGSAYCVTVQLQMQYVATAKIGEFIICEAEIIRQTRDLFFVRGLMTVGDTIVASADGIWKVLEQR